MILRGKVTEQIGFQWCRNTSGRVVTKMLGAGGGWGVWGKGSRYFCPTIQK